MAISTGDICSDAMAALQAEVAKGAGVDLSLKNLCFIFRKGIDYSDADMLVNFQDMCDYLSTQPWIEDSSMVFYTDWLKQTAVISRAPQLTASTRVGP